MLTADDYGVRISLIQKVCRSSLVYALAGLEVLYDGRYPALQAGLSQEGLSALEGMQAERAPEVLKIAPGRWANCSLAPSGRRGSIADG